MTSIVPAFTLKKVMAAKTIYHFMYILKQDYATILPLKYQLQNHFDGTLTCNRENDTSSIPTMHPEHMFLHYVT